jgi:hypothetical protein
MTPPSADTAPLYDLAEALGHTFGADDRNAIHAVRVVHALLTDTVLTAIADTTALPPKAVREYLLAMAELITREGGGR